MLRGPLLLRPGAQSCVDTGDSGGLWPFNRDLRTTVPRDRAGLPPLPTHPGAGGWPSLPCCRTGQRWESVERRNRFHGAGLPLRTAWSHPAKAKPGPLTRAAAKLYWMQAGRAIQCSPGARAPQSIVCLSHAAELPWAIWRPPSRGGGHSACQRGVRVGGCGDSP